MSSGSKDSQPASARPETRAAAVRIARTVATHLQAQRLFGQFFDRLAHVERTDRWTWLERHAAILPQELDQLKSWYATANLRRPVPLVPLKQLLDSLEKRLKT